MERGSVPDWEDDHDRPAPSPSRGREHAGDGGAGAPGLGRSGNKTPSPKRLKALVQAGIAGGSGDGAASPASSFGEGSSTSSEAKTAVKPRVPHAGVGAEGSAIRVGDRVLVAVETRWSREYRGIVGYVQRWWTPHNPKADNRCVVSFPPPLGPRIINACVLLPEPDIPADPAANNGTPVGPANAIALGNRAIFSGLRVDVPNGGAGVLPADDEVKYKAVDFVLNAVIRQSQMQAQEKLLAISRICHKTYGEYVCKALAGNGCNIETKSLDGCPMWDRAVLQMCKLLSIKGLEAADASEAEAVAEALAATRGWSRLSADQARREVRNVYVAVQDGSNGESAAGGVEFSVPRGMLLHDGLRVAGLTSLDLSDQKITSVSLPRLLKPLLEGECIALCRVRLSGNPIQDVGAAHLLPLLGSSMPVGTRLECLDVSNCMIWAKGCVMIANALRANKHLVTLSLGGNDAGSPTCTAVAEMLQVNTTLRNLDLSHAGIPPGGMEQLARSLTHVSLRQLNLGRNCGGTGPANMEVWRHSLQANVSLKWLNLPCSPRLPAAARESVVEQLAGFEIVLPLEMKIALCMGLHKRLGAGSLLNCVSEHALFEILRFSWVPRVVTFEVSNDENEPVSNP